MPTIRHLSPQQYHFVYVVCTPRSQPQLLYKFDAYGHHPKQPPGMTVESGSLSLLRP
jgi:hypothetical protein